MAATTTPSGMQSGIDSTELTWNAGHNQVWEQNGLTETAGYVDQGVNSVGFFTWKQARSDDNKNNHAYGP